MKINVTLPYTSWTHRLARVVVRPMVNTRITPNHLTTVRFLAGLAACLCFAMGQRQADILGGILWIVSAFFDRADGELARLSGKASPGGHYYDYVTDVAVNSLFFVAIGIGLGQGPLGFWAPLFGILAGASVAYASLLCERYEKDSGATEKAYSGVAGFDFDDILYIFGPVAWLGWFMPILVGAAIGAPAFAIMTWWRFRSQWQKRSSVDVNP